MEPEGDASASPQFLDTDAIQNLDTARMALRWALERIQKLDRDKAELVEKAGLEERAKKKALEEYASLQRTLSLRANESDQRELYYAKLEEFLSLKLEGKIDAASLAKRELEIEQLRTLLDHKQGQLEKEYELKRATLDSDYRRLREESQTQLRDQQKRLEQASDSRRTQLEQDHLQRMADIHNKEARLKQEEKSFADRQAHFEQYYREQRAALQVELKNVRSEIEDQVRFRAETAERVLSERQAALEASWSQERALLQRELEGWKRRCQELGPQVIELQTALALADEAGRKSQASSDVNALSLKEREGTWAAERDALSRLLEQTKRDWSKASEELLRAQKGLSAAEEDARQARASSESLAAAFEAEKGSFARLRQALEAQLQDWRGKGEDSQARSFELERRLALAEDALAQGKADAQQQLALAQERLKAARAECDRLAEARKTEAQWAAQQSRKAIELEQRAATLEEELSRAKAEATADRERWQERLAFLERERQTLNAELTALRQGEEASVKGALDLSRKSIAAQEAEAEALRRCARLEQALAHAESARKAVEQETADRLRAENERHADRLKERETAWERERADLERELGELRQRPVKKAELLVELEKKLAAERALPAAEPPPAPER